jgi:hypothetical protein
MIFNKSRKLNKHSKLLIAGASGKLINSSAFGVQRP